MEAKQTLTAHPLFRGVAASRLERCLETVEKVRLERGEVLYTPQRYRDCLGVIRSGRMRVSKGSLVVSVLGPGDVFGAAALFPEFGGYATTLTALSVCEVVLIGREAVLSLVREDPRFAENYVRYLSGRIQFLSDRLDAVSADTAGGKLAQYLLSAAGEDGTVVISATQLSARVGVGRATIYRAFETLEQQGAIAREGKTIRLLDRNALKGIMNP